MKRINVIGSSGSGKSHFSKALAENMGIEYIQIDAIYWQPNWVEPSNHLFFAKLEEAISKDTWVLDGNYAKASKIKWQRVDTIIWLDYGFFRTFKQLFVRSIKRAWSKREIWAGTGNRESFRKNFLSSGSVILWMLKTYKKNKRKYGKLFSENDFVNVELIRIQSPKQAEAFLNNVYSTKEPALTGHRS